MPDDPPTGVSSYSVAGAALEDRDADTVFFTALKAQVNHEVIEVDAAAEDDAFIDQAVAKLVELVAKKQGV